MLDYSEPFGHEVRRVLKETGQSPNSVELHSQRRISHMTVRRMLKGYVPGSDYIGLMVDAIGEARQWPIEQRAQVANRLLELAQSRMRYANINHTLLAA